MKAYRCLAVAVCALVLIACGKNGGTLNLEVSGQNATGAPRPLFSLWRADLYQLDLRSAQFGVTSPATVTTITSQTCTCQVVVNGTENSGNMQTSSCSGNYPDCASFNYFATYTKSNAGLRICLTTNNCTDLK